ncbi:thiol:disulfide interchange protein DsbA/DsbL [Luteimonas vadosa]|uniref:Thioredoxin domain-containing protein n=1 Tax=Luteimonas vadosa TaxID=1165507 RepID=A0ABP9DRV9_9GAMM
MIHRQTFVLLAALTLAGLLPVAGHAQAAKPAPAPVEGVDYVAIEGGQPWQPLAGKIEVVEVFAYWCHHCRDFQPMVDQWRKGLAKDVRFTYVPAAFDLQDNYARAYFAADALGAQGKTHHATFRAIHDTQAMPSRGVSVEEIATFYDGLGVNAKRTRAAMTSKATDARMQAAREFAIRSGIEGTPTIVVNGIWRVRGRTLPDVLRITDALVARERARRAASTTP